jgi:hypothetical protein
MPPIIIIIPISVIASMSMFDSHLFLEVVQFGTLGLQLEIVLVLEGG